MAFARLSQFPIPLVSGACDDRVKSLVWSGFVALHHAFLWVCAVKHITGDGFSVIRLHTALLFVRWDGWRKK